MENGSDLKSGKFGLRRETTSLNNSYDSLKYRGDLVDLVLLKMKYDGVNDELDILDQNSKSVLFGVENYKRFMINFEGDVGVNVEYVFVFQNYMQFQSMLCGLLNYSIPVCDRPLVFDYKFDIDIQDKYMGIIGPSVFLSGFKERNLVDIAFDNLAKADSLFESFRN